MKKILITGANSYIGTSFEKWVSQYADQYIVDTLDMKNDKWKVKDFSIYDVIFHVAGIAHVTSNPKMEHLYFKINRDLAVETANKAKEEGVSQFIFMSSIIVYGDSLKSNTTKRIDQNTVPSPTNVYGKSKLQAEKEIIKLTNDKFNTVIIRSPMIYGKQSKGNYKKLSKIARYLPFFPKYKNKRSMLYIDNLCEFIRMIIDNKDCGVFFPQNSEYVATYELVKLISQIHRKKVLFTRGFNPFIWVLKDRIGIINKVFGDCFYDRNLSKYRQPYCIIDFVESVIASEL